MTEWLPHVSQFVVFLAISGLGFVFLVIALLFGEVFEHFDASFDHDLDAGDGPGIFSARVLSVFITAFGGFGAVSTYYGLSTLPASGVGFASGVFFGGLIYGFARFLYGQQATSGVKSNDLVGHQARVVVAIPAAGVGQVRCQLGEELVDKIARSRDGGAIPENVAVLIEEVLGDTVIVRRQSA
jgi:hypothetical protein